MIWVRRVLAIPLIILFIILFVVLLVVTQVNGTVGSAGFYNSQMRQADMYNFIYDEALPAALDDIETDEPSDMPIEISDFKADIVSTARKMVPPEWLREMVESATNTAIPYLLGDTDSFTYTVVLKDRVGTAADVLKNDVFQGDTFDRLYDEVISYAADKMVENLDEMPYALSLSKAEIETTLKEVADKDWISSEAGAAIDSIKPYLVGDSEYFTITIQLRDRVDPTAAAVIALLSRQETYDYLLDEMITPIVVENIGSSIYLPYGISLSKSEVSAAVKQVLPQAWLQARFEEVINEVAAYVKEESNEIRIAVDLTDREAAALDVLTELTDQKLEAKFYSLPVCSMSEFLIAIQNLPPNTLPSCRPSGVTYENAKTMLNIDLAATVEQTVGDKIPNQWVYTDADLRQSLGAEDSDFLDKIRERVSQGWNFTEADLLDKLGSDDKQTLDDARGWIRDGYTLTEADLRDEISDSDTELKDFDDIRHRIGSVRHWLPAIWLIPFVILVFIGLLGGRNWISKAAWGLTVLFVTSLIIYIAVALTYSQVGEPRLQEITFDTAQYEGVELVMAEKGNEVIQNVAGAFASGIEWMAIYSMIGSGLVLLGLVIWKWVLPRTRAV